MTDPILSSKAEEIAKGLTKAQRETLIHHEQPYEWRWENVPARAPDSWQNCGRSMLELRLLEWHPNKRRTATRMTPLGLEVRAILQAQQ